VTLVLRKDKWVVYGDDGKVVIICSQKEICVRVADALKKGD